MSWSYRDHLDNFISALFRLLHVVRDLWVLQNYNCTVSQAFDDVVRRNPKKILLRFEEQKWTAEQIQELANKVANYFQAEGYRKGDTVAIFMENCSEYTILWLGLSKIGVVSSLVNYNLRLQSLKHCFEAVSCKAIIYSPGLSTALEELDLGTKPLFCIGKETSAKLSNVSKDLMTQLRDVKGTQPVVKETIGFLDNLMYIYTSGTTGLPKASTIKNSRFLMAAVGVFYMHGLKKTDTLYTSLPLYHGAGTFLGAGTMLTYGVTQVVRKKFSASNFWKDCIAYDVTVAQYIGEICRYLVTQPPSSLDKGHKVRVMFGNGLKLEIWKEFVERFGIKHIGEIYGATEGNCNIVNIDSRIGAVGFLPVLFSYVHPLKIIKVDEVTGEPLRDKDTGFAIECKPNEPGELIGKIRRSHPLLDFEGYADKSSSKDKVLSNVWRKGDAWFRSGDILLKDELGYIFFKDRKGDTFRWKGENCSTLEIEAVISTITKEDAVVFGVEVPGAEGRAGMVVIGNPDNNLDLNNLALCVNKALPSYARPVFVRISPKLEMTGTYKLKKVDYQKVGFDIHKTSDKIYFYNGNKYVELSAELYDDIVASKLRF
ncbi:long-chain fatty acid transport protein 4 isoform X2 [Folsomia candida]|uniref:long-chain fatty acid transport protein 4 isoform X2 n=1 Tax=Folsomia candida TaxID=158441 RepID=UPI001604D960|nr:long-chain fatty acid transport protein 4 isoform X2 [Folsomia candida]